MSLFGKELIESAKEALEIARGNRKSAREYHVQDVDVAAIRKKLGVSQREFSERYGLKLTVVRDWEQHRTRPDQTARSYLRVIEKDPEVVVEALRA